jgi:hypothetical protein
MAQPAVMNAGVPARASAHIEAFEADLGLTYRTCV